MTDSEKDPEIITSRHNGYVTKDNVTVQLCIYRLENTKRTLKWSTLRVPRRFGMMSLKLMMPLTPSFRKPSLKGCLNSSRPLPSE